MDTVLNLQNKKAVIFGVATERSLAWKIAKTLNDHGCRVALGFQERVRNNVEKLATMLDDPVLAPCDVTEDQQIKGFFGQIEEEFRSFDFLIHSIAFAPKECLKGSFFEVDRCSYNLTQEISAYSLAAMVQAGQHLMNDNGRIIAMTYLGSSFSVTNYNVMGVAKAALEASIRYLAKDLGERGITANAISAGPVKTVAAAGINGFEKILAVVKERSPLKRNIDGQDVGNTALFLCSDLARNITAQVLHVDAGFSTVSM